MVSKDFIQFIAFSTINFLYLALRFLRILLETGSMNYLR